MSQLPALPCFAVAGHPILASASAPLFRALFERLGMRASYTRLSAPAAEGLLPAAAQLGLAGLNVTSPHKQSLLPWLGTLSPEAQAVGAINTLVHSPDGWLGDNSDVLGVEATLRLHGVPREGTRVLVLGAGGAARAVLVALRRAGFSELVMCNRGQERGMVVARALGVPLVGLDKLEAELSRCRLLISCVPGDPPLIPAAWLRPGQWVFDANYRARNLHRAARLAGCRIIPGSDWLALQAAASFEVFTGHELDEPSRSWLRERASLPAAPPTGPVVLTGFSGAGKSSVGAILARMLGWAFVDTDAEVERRSGLDIPTLFAQRGERAFRALERQAVARALAQPRSVVALGGGALLHPETRSDLAEGGLRVLLHAPLPTCLERAAQGRPLLSDPGRAPQLWAERRDGYLDRAELVVANTGPHPESAARQLLAELETVGLIPGSGPAAPELTLHPGRLSGTIHSAPASKSHAIRLLCAAALGDGSSRLDAPPRCEDFRAAVGICEQLGASIDHGPDHLLVRGRGWRSPERREPLRLDCRESAFCLRMFSCVAAALGGPFLLDARGSLLERSVEDLEHVMHDLGVRCGSRGGRPPLRIEGPIARQRVLLDASGSSQVLSGLLMALPMLPHRTEVAARGLVSRPYAKLTLEVLRSAGVEIEANADLVHFVVPGPQRPRAFRARVDRDWSALAFLLVAGATTGSVEVRGVELQSSQGDRAVLEVLEEAGALVELGAHSVRVSHRPLRAFSFDGTHHPDLFPPLAVLAAACEGRTELRGVGRLRNKESDRARALQQELGALGIRIELQDDSMLIHGGPVRSGKVDAHGDHRIAMALALAALRADAPCTLRGAEHVAKSYPRFFHDLAALCEDEA